MFGKPEWFKRLSSWGLLPTCRQGWIYSLIWLAVIIIPTLLLLGLKGTPTALIWLVASVVLLAWEGRTLLAAMENQERKNLFFIGEEEADAKVATRNFDLHVRE